MKAVAVFPKARELRIVECEEPHIMHPTEVKLRMLEVGICGTDKEISTFEYGTPPPGSDYLIIGHESLGEVVEVGPDVHDIHIGDLAVTMVRRPCSREDCRPCRFGRPDFCRSGEFTERGIIGAHGFMAEYVVDDARYMNVVPAALREVAVLVEPLTIAAKALFQARKITERLPWIEGHLIPELMHAPGSRGLTALVLGGGAVGLLGAMALRVGGFDVHVYDRTPAPNPKSALVEAIGAHHDSEADTSKAFAHLLGEVDLVYEAVGASQLAFKAMSVLGPNSIFILTGVPALGATSHVDTDTIMRNAVLKNQVILGTVNAGKADFEAAIAALGVFMRQWPEATRSLITGRYPLDAYGDLLLGHPGGIKNLLSFAGARKSSADSSRANAMA